MFADNCVILKCSVGDKCRETDPGESTARIFCTAVPGWGMVVVRGFDTKLWLPEDQTDSTSFNFSVLQSHAGTVTVWIYKD